MKILHSIALILFLLSSCVEEPSSTKADGGSDSITWAPPAITNVEVYINRYTLSPTDGAIGRPNLSYWSKNSKMTYFYSLDSNGEVPYKAKITYKGKHEGKDHYVTHISYPSETGIQTSERTIVYEGKDIELYKDSTHRIGIRPLTSNKDS